MNRRIFPWLMLIASPVVIVLCLMAGASTLGLPDIATPTGRSIFFLRLDRVITALVIGAALGVSGALLQTVLRNPLAEPYVLGVSSGAGMGAALAISAGLAGLSAAAVPVSAFVSACATLAIVYALAGNAGPISIYGLILSGVIVSSVCSSILMCVIALSNSESIHGIMWWMLGNMEMHPRETLVICSILIACGIAGSWMISPELNALAVGRDMAHHVGIRTRLAIGLALGLATLTTASAVAVGGLVGFVGLVVPHVMRAITGPDHRRLIPATALAGGLFLAVSDAIARTVIAPRDLPVGVITAIVGGPFFLAVLRNKKKRGWIE